MTKAERIRILREDRGISQVELAERIGVSKQNMYKYENDIITNIPSDKIESMAKVLNVSPGYIMGWEDDKDKISDISATNANESMIGNRLKQLRESKGYNMRQMAAALNLPYTTYVNYEKGEREPNSEQLILFSKYFDVSIDYIIGITNDIKSCELPSTDEFKVSIGTQIKRRREELGMTQPVLASLVGVSKGSIGNYESGISSPNEPILIKLFEALKCDANYLYQDYINFESENDISVLKDNITTHEREIISAYREQSESVKAAICKMLDVEYTEKKPQLTTIYRAARSVDNHPAEIVETTKDFSKIPPTDIKF